MTKEKAWDNFVTQLNNFGWYSDRNFLKTAWGKSWDAAYTDGYNQAKLEIKAREYDELPEKHFEYKHVQYGYRFIAHPDGTLTVTPTGVNEK